MNFPCDSCIDLEESNWLAGPKLIRSAVLSTVGAKQEDTEGFYRWIGITNQMIKINSGSYNPKP